MVSQVSMEAEAGSHADQSDSEEDSDSEDSEWEEEEEQIGKKKSECLYSLFNPGQPVYKMAARIMRRRRSGSN